MKPATARNTTATGSPTAGQNTGEFSVALVPDRLGAYRYSIFKRLSDYKKNGFRLAIYADSKEDMPGLKIVNPAYSDLDYDNGGIAWGQVYNHCLKRICFWQSGLPFFGTPVVSHDNFAMQGPEFEAIVPGDPETSIAMATLRIFVQRWKTPSSVLKTDKFRRKVAGKTFSSTTMLSTNMAFSNPYWKVCNPYVDNPLLQN